VEDKKEKSIMEGVKKILVALGFSEYAKGIFDYSANLAKSLDAQLIVANVINSRDVEAVASVASMGYEIDGEHYTSAIKEERKKKLEEIQKESVFKDESLKTIFKVGNPIDELLKIIIEEKVDMVVMGVSKKKSIWWLWESRGVRTSKVSSSGRLPRRCFAVAPSLASLTGMKKMPSD